MLQPRVEVKKACENFPKKLAQQKTEREAFPSSIFFYFARIAAVACLLVTNIYSTFRWMGKLEIETRTQLFMCVSNNSTLSHPLILLIGCRFSAIFRRKTGG